MPAILGESTFGFELRDGGRIRGVLVGVDDSWRGMVRRRSLCDRRHFGKARLKSTKSTGLCKSSLWHS